MELFEIMLSNIVHSHFSLKPMANTNPGAVYLLPTDDGTVDEFTIEEYNTHTVCQHIHNSTRGVISQHK